MSVSFLEFAVGTDDILESLHFYRGLGFSELAAGDATAYPYAVISDGRICIGLHRVDEFEPAVRFVRPNVRQAVLALSDANLDFEELHLGEDELHRVSLRGPNGNKATWIEARTFSPPLPEVGDSALGRFLELTLPVAELYAAARFWAPFADRVVGEAEEPARMRFDAHGLALGLCESRLREPLLAFHVEQADALQATMDRLGIVPAPGRLPDDAFAMLRAPEGTSLVLYRSDFLD